MADLMTMMAQYMGLIYSILAFGLALAIYVAFRYQINFWWLNAWYSLPIIGKLARLSKDTTRSSNAGWLRAEETLCADYRKHILTTSETEFRKRLVYMGKAQDLGRRPLPGWMVVVLAILLVAEGLGFSYLLGTWMAREGSANVHTLLMLAIVFVIGTIMLLLTHAAGHQLYRTGLIRRCDKEWRDHGQHVLFKTGEVQLDQDQSIDDAAMPFTQTINRVGDHGGYAMVAIAIVAVLSIAAVSTWMRVSHLDQEMIAQTAVGLANGATGNPFATGSAPAELSGPQHEADMKAQVEALSSQRSEGFAAFIMLAMIFVVTQIVSIYAGYKFGFAGKQSGDAYKGTRGFSTYDDYMDRFEPMIQVGQAKLQTLQRNLSALRGNVGLNLHKTFDDYIRDAEARRVSRRQPVAAVPLRPTGESHVESPARPESLAVPTNLEEVLHRIGQLATADEKAALLATLPEPLKNETVAYLKAEKARAAEARRLASEQELKDLF